MPGERTECKIERTRAVRQAHLAELLRRSSHLVCCSTHSRGRVGHVSISGTLKTLARAYTGAKVVGRLRGRGTRQFQSTRKTYLDSRAPRSSIRAREGVPWVAQGPSTTDGHDLKEGRRRRTLLARNQRCLRATGRGCSSYCEYYPAFPLVCTSCSHCDSVRFTMLPCQRRRTTRDLGLHMFRKATRHAARYHACSARDRDRGEALVYTRGRRASKFRCEFRP